MSCVPGRETAKAATSQRTGTVRWNAPELQPDICRSDSHELPTPETDVWSFATTVWEALTGRVPYISGDDRGCDVSVSVAILMGTSPAAHTGTVLPSGVPGAVTLLLERCWNRDPRRRPSMRMVATELAKALAHLSGPSFPRKALSPATSIVDCTKATESDLHEHAGERDAIGGWVWWHSHGLIFDCDCMCDVQIPRLLSSGKNQFPQSRETLLAPQSRL